MEECNDGMPGYKLKDAGFKLPARCRRVSGLLQCLPLPAYRPAPPDARTSDNVNRCLPEGMG